MGYPGRHNIYEATIRRMVLQALEERELQFRLAHEADREEALLLLLRQKAAELGHTPWPGEMDGGAYLKERFGSWQQALERAGLSPPSTPNQPRSFRRYKLEEQRQKECYRQRKQEKKQLAQKRVAEQKARRSAREKR